MQKQRTETWKSTGEVCVELEVSESYLVSLFRLGKMKSPPVVGRRRRWAPEHVEQARIVVRRMRSG